MKVTIQSGFEKFSSQGTLVLIHGVGSLPAKALPEPIRAEFRRFCADAEAGRAKRPRSLLIARGKIRRRVYMTSLSFHQGHAEIERPKIAAAEAYQDARDQGDTRLGFCLPGDQDPAQAAAQLVEGMELGAYRFSRYRSDNGKKGTDPAVSFFVGSSAKKTVQEAVLRAQELARSVNAARDLINLPGSDLSPEDLARHARRVAKASGLSCEILEEKRLKKEGYNALLAVGAGSRRPPCMIILRYRPSETPTPKHLCLVGKGVTFDTGGLSVKTGIVATLYSAPDMWTMKSDMAGAAAVLHAIEAIARRRLPLDVTAVLVAAENALGPRSVLPGDIFVSRCGKTVQVTNTDAEGRLVLTDALYRAGEENATHVVDVATLTGGCVSALGMSITGLMGNDAALIGKIIEAGAASGEDIWQLPLYEGYREFLKTPAADLNNIASYPYAKAIMAAIFLGEFVPKGVAWAHLDIAGTAFHEKKWKYFEPGGAGVMVRTLTRLAETL